MILCFFSNLLIYNSICIRARKITLPVYPFYLVCFYLNFWYKSIQNFEYLKMFALVY